MESKIYRFMTHMMVKLNLNFFLKKFQKGGNVAGTWNSDTHHKAWWEFGTFFYNDLCWQKIYILMYKMFTKSEQYQE